MSFSFKLIIFHMHCNKWHLEPTDPPNRRNWRELLSNHLPSPPPTSCRPPWPWWRCCCHGTSGARCLEQPPPTRQQWTKCGLTLNFIRRVPPPPTTTLSSSSFLQHIQNKITTFLFFIFYNLTLSCLGVLIPSPPTHHPTLYLKVSFAWTESDHLTTQSV